MTDSLRPFKMNSIAMNVSREMLILSGDVVPTAEEVERHNAESRASWMKSIADWDRADAFRAALAEVNDTVARIVLDIHRPVDDDTAECHHCTSGEAADHDAWPCTTVNAVARAVGIEPPDAWLGHRPGPEPSTMPPEGYKRWTYPTPFVDALARTMDATVFRGHP